MLSAKQRDNIYILLREYHEVPAVTKPSTTEIELLVHDLEFMADNIISAVLGILRGDETVKDWAKELSVFALRAKPQATHTPVENQERVEVSKKIELLEKVFSLAQKTV